MLDTKTPATALEDWPLVAAGRVRLLDVDPELSQNGAEPEGARLLTAPVYRLARGRLPAPGERPGAPGHLGFLIVSGLVMREVVVCGRPSAEMLGPGDLIRPWTREVVELLPRTVNWVV